MSAFRDFHQSGFSIFTKVFGGDRIAAILEEADRLHERGSAFQKTTEDGPARWLIAAAGESAVLRGLQNPHRLSPIIEALRTDAALARLLAPLIGDDVLTVVMTLFWKPPGESLTGIAYHQDCAFRRPREHFQHLGTSYVQLGIALDPHGPANGGMRVVAGSHRRGDLAIQRDSSVMLDEPRSFDLAAYGLSEHDERDIALDPGDVIAWSPYLLHGSPANTSSRLNRRFLVVGYMRSRDCAVGEPAFVDGAAHSSYPTARL